MAAKRTARSEPIQANGQARSLIVTGPDGLRARFAGHSADDLAAELAALRPRPGSMVRCHTLLSLRGLGRRAAVPDGQPQRLDALIVPLVAARAPGLLALYGAGHDTTAKLLIAAADHPQRLRSEAAWAHLCAAAPIPASPGEGHPPPARPRRRPAGRPRPVPDRDHPDQLPPAHPRPRRPAQQRRPLPEGDHPLPHWRYLAREVYPCLRPGAG